MIYVIQTNTIFNNGIPGDFQSMVFAWDRHWEDYKHALLHKESDGKIITGTMYGSIKPRGSKIEKIIINDDHHVECILNNGVVTINVKAYKVDVNNLNHIVND